MRAVVDAAAPFDDAVRRRIFRYAAERLGLDFNAASPTVEPPPGEAGWSGESSRLVQARPSDIRSFLAEKNPRADTHKAAAVAYFYRFVAPGPERKEEIGSAELQNAMRQAGWHVFKNPAVPLRNAAATGFLDRTKKGAYCINAVGENLVAMLLPNGGEAPPRKSARARRKAGKQRKA